MLYHFMHLYYTFFHIIMTKLGLGFSSLSKLGFPIWYNNSLIYISILSHACPDRVNPLSLVLFRITGKCLPVGVFVGNLVGLFVGDLLGLFGHFWPLWPLSDHDRLLTTLTTLTTLHTHAYMHARTNTMRMYVYISFYTESKFVLSTFTSKLFFFFSIFPPAIKSLPFTFPSLTSLFRVAIKRDYPNTQERHPFLRRV